MGHSRKTVAFFIAAQATKATALGAGNEGSVRKRAAGHFCQMS
jgi:hypothetical protein